MANRFYKNPKIIKGNKKMTHIIFIFLLLAQFSLIACDASCSLGTYLSDSSCFNNVIYFNHLNYRSGHFASKKNGDLVLEYSGDPRFAKRLFYGLKTNGRGLFNDGYIREKDLPSEHGRFEARNLFVSLKSDGNKEKEYLFSTSSYQSWTELHDLENDNYVYRYSDTFNGKRIFSFVYSLFATTFDNYYFLLFTSPDSTNSEAEDGKLVVIKKFAFTGFDLTNYENHQITFSKFGDRVISGFIMEEEKVLVILYLKRSTDNSGGIYAQYNIRFYDYSLNQKGNDINNYGTTLKNDQNIKEHVGLFANSIYLKDRIGLFIYFHSGNFIFQSFKFTFENGNYKKDDVFFKQFNSSTYGFDSSVMLNDVHKINDNRIAVITSKSSGTKLYIILLDFYGSYKNYKFRLYNYNLFSGSKLNKELAVYSYNREFLAFSSTISPTNNDDQYTSFLLFFSYPNGTDFTIDIGFYLKDSKYYDSSKNLFSYLMDEMKIENNIFRYKKVQKIKLVSIPDEIIFYNGDGTTQLKNGDYLFTNYVLKQNMEIKKTYENYHLYYQYIAEEPSYSELYYSGLDIQGDGDFSSSYSSKEVYGRTNKLSFKLCHGYCEMCYIISNDNDHQNCTSCLLENTYDYLAYTNNFTGNCVPKGQMYDKENQKLLTCEGNDFKYYFNISRENEKYCFKYLYECPDVYPYLNITTNECINYTEIIPTTIVTTIPIIPTTEPKIPTTEPKIPTTEPKIPTTEPKIPTTEPKIPTTEPKIPTTEPKIPTTEPKIPTTEPKIPTTEPKIPTTEPKIPTTEPKIPTTEPKTPTTEPNIPTTEPKIPTTIPIIPTIILTTIPEIIKTTIITNLPTPSIICNYYTIYSQCIFTNLTDEKIYTKLKKDIVTTYPNNGVSVMVNGSNGYSFQVTNTNNENNNLNSEGDLSVINLGECENTLRTIYHIDDDLSIIILKYLNPETNGKNFIYELYHPTNHEKLNLSYCQNVTYDLHIPIDLDSSVIKAYSNAKEQGYDLFNSEDSFYKKICTRYTSESGTDVILDDRMSFYYNKVANYTACPINCKYISYSVETKYLKCECGINDADISTFDLNHIIDKNTYKSFYSTLKYSNYKVMRCYNLVFDFKIFCHNAGSILTLILFIIYIIFIILYFLKDISPLKISISKLLFEKSNIYESNEIQIINNEKKDKIKKNMSNKNLIIDEETKNRLKYPPKKNKKIKVEKENSIKSKSNDKFGFLNQNKDRKKEKISPNNLIKKNIRKNDKKTTKDAKNFDKNNLEIFKVKTKKDKNEKSIISDDNQTNKRLNEKISTNNLEMKDKTLENKSPNFEDYDNFELNNLDYIPACEIDKRSFCRTYCSVLLREHIVLMTFVACNDYNLFYVKVDRFIIQFCTNMAMNGLFFSDESMHNLYVNNGEYDFVQQIPQIAYTLIIGHVLEVILCYLSLTDTVVYAIKELSKNKENVGKIMQIINCLKTKLIIFFIFTFLLFLFYWYFISAFCAVYQNTQEIFIRDSMTSFITSMIDPFLIYLFTSILRGISLSGCCKKKAGFVYCASQLIPIF